MIDFYFGDKQINIQLIPVYGLSLGVLYYNPNLHQDEEPVEEEDYFQQITFMFLFFGIHITIL